MTNRERLLVTGAAGYVAGLIMPTLRDHFALRRLDIADQSGEGDDELVLADIADTDAVAAACDGVAGVVHLAAKAFEDDFLSVLLPRNVIGTWSVFEAAVAARVPVLVFASTGQTVGGNRADTVVTADLPPRPVSVYACTKLFGEALGRFHADRGDLRVACLRLGWVVPPDSPLFATESTLPGLWCAPDDLARLVLASIASDVSYSTVLAFSPPATTRFDTTNPYGWAPRDEPLAT